MKKLLVAALMVVLASPAFAAIQNVKVSGDITSTWVDRNNFDLGLTNNINSLNFGDGSFGAGGSNPAGLKKQNVFLTQTRLRVDADLSDNVSTTVGLINERAWNGEQTYGYGGGSVNDTNVQLYLASVTMRELLYSPLTVTVGRQVFSYGNGLVLGDGGVNNLGTGNLQFVAQDLTMRTAYDGVKAVLDYKPLTIDVFYFKNGQSNVGGFYSPSDKTSSDVYGINANYQLSDPMNTVLEGYLFTRLDGKQFVSSGTYTNDKSNSLYVPGLRASTNPIKGLNVQGEVAWQLGQATVYPRDNFGVPTANQESERRSAMAAQFLASYALPVLDKYKPTVNASYTYVSGDKNANGNVNTNIPPVGTKSAKVYGAWDSFNETQGGGTIYNTLFPLTNMNIVALGASANPLEDVTTAFTYSNLWAAQSYNGYNPLLIYQPNSGGTLYAPSTKAGQRGLGNEYDVNVTYNYTEDVTFGVSLGWFVAGSAFEGTGTGANSGTASQALANVAVKF